MYLSQYVKGNFKNRLLFTNIICLSGLSCINNNYSFILSIYTAMVLFDFIIVTHLFKTKSRTFLKIIPSLSRQMIFLFFPQSFPLISSFL